MLDKHEVLQEYFGYRDFREGQAQLVDAVLARKDALGIMPTGAGKSICYQVPSLMLEGITLVVSPLISLMRDQVTALVQAGVPAAFLNSSLTPTQSRKALENAWAGKYKIIYIAPERLCTPSFMQFANSANISFISIDEAHCISQWGQDFRPSYLKVTDFIHSLPQRPPVGAYTATATERVKQDIIELLELKNPVQVSTGYDRPNLYYEVQSPTSKIHTLLEFLKKQQDNSGIVYCLTRKAVEDVCHTLQNYGYSATRYHAGLPDMERHQNQEDFINDNISIMVATNAFGMGIDKSNVRFVVHYNMPKNIESYYQEAGRAGRDGLPSHCLLLYGGKDVITNQFFIDKSAEENTDLDEESAKFFKVQEEERLRQMTFYCHTHNCLRGYILDYFGQQSDMQCGNCHRCKHGLETTDITAHAQKILTCINRMGGRYGLTMVTDVLRGSKSERITSWKLDQISVYGTMKDVLPVHIREIVQYLTAKEYIAVEDGKYPTLSVTHKAKDVLEGDVSLEMGLSKPSQTSRRQLKKSYSGKNLPLKTGEQELFDQLRQLRAELARKQGVPAYVVFSDATLREMCEEQPIDLSAFASISGVGEVKIKRYGTAFIKLIRGYNGI